MTNAPPIYVIVSHARSGSTLLQRILDNQPEICAPTEPWLFFNLHAAFESDTFPSQAFRHFAGSDRSSYYRTLIQAVIADHLSASGKTIFVEKTPRNNEILNFIESMDMPVRYIYLLRDLRSVLWSELNRWGARFRTMHRITGRVFSEIHRIAKTQARMDAFIDGIAPFRAHVLRYEELVQQPHEALSLLCAWMKTARPISVEYGPEDICLGDLKSQMHSRPHTASIDSWKKGLLFPERLYFERCFPDALRAVWSRRSAFADSRSHSP